MFNKNISHIGLLHILVVLNDFNVHPSSREVHMNFTWTSQQLHKIFIYVHICCEAMINRQYTNK